MQCFHTSSSAARSPPSLPRQANGERAKDILLQTSQTGGGARPHFDPKERFTMKKLIVILLAVALSS